MTAPAPIDNPAFQNDYNAREYLESVRWPTGPVCVHCGATENIVRVEGVKRSHRAGLLYCNACKGTFTVTVGTVYERSKIPLHKWLYATYLLSTGKKGTSAHQLMRMLGLGSYRTAWFMAHRIREAMSEGYVRAKGPIGGAGKTVEADETYVGPQAGKDTRVQRKLDGAHGPHVHMMKVYSLVERGGNVRTFHVRDVSARTLMGVMQDQVHRESRIYTDDARQYRGARRVFLGGHQSVNHSAKEYVFGDAHTNTVENYFSILKRGLYGTYQHVSEKHLRRYCDEFDFRYNNRHLTDFERATVALVGIEGKRLTYRRTRSEAQ